MQPNAHCYNLILPEISAYLFICYASWPTHGIFHTLFLEVVSFM